MRRIDLETGGRELRTELPEAISADVAEADIEARADLISAMFDRAALVCVYGSPTAAFERALDTVLVSVVSAKKTSARVSTEHLHEWPVRESRVAACH